MKLMAKRVASVALAAMAMLAVGGSASAAAEELFTAGKAGVPIKETTLEEHVLTVTGKTVACEEFNLEGETEFETSELALHPVYGKCKAFGFAATVTSTDCELSLKAHTEKELAAANLHDCTNGGLTVVVNNGSAKCIVHVVEQSLGNAVSYGGGPGDVAVTFAASGLHANVEVSEGACPLTTGTHKTATYSGKSTIKAEGSSLDWELEPSLFLAGEEGAPLESETLEEEDVFTLTEQPFGCKTVILEGSSKLSSGHLIVHPVFSECTWKGAALVTVSAPGCVYRLGAATSLGEGTVHLEGCSNEGIDILLQFPFSLTCEVFLPEQSIGAATTYSNIGKSLEVEFAAEGIGAAVIKSTGFCPMTLGSHEGAKGATFAGKTLLSAEGTTLEWSE